MVTKYQRKKKRVDSIVHYENRDDHAINTLQIVMVFAFIVVLFVFWVTT